MWGDLDALDGADEQRCHPHPSYTLPTLSPNPPYTLPTPSLHPPDTLPVHLRERELLEHSVQST